MDMSDGAVGGVDVEAADFVGLCRMRRLVLR